MYSLVLKPWRWLAGLAATFLGSTTGAAGFYAATGALGATTGALVATGRASPTGLAAGAAGRTATASGLPLAGSLLSATTIAGAAPFSDPAGFTAGFDAAATGLAAGAGFAACTGLATAFSTFAGALWALATTGVLDSFTTFLTATLTMLFLPLVAFEGLSGWAERSLPSMRDLPAALVFATSMVPATDAGEGRRVILSMTAFVFLAAAGLTQVQLM